MEPVGAMRGADPGTVVALLGDNDQSLTDGPEWAGEFGNVVRVTGDLDDHYRIVAEKP